MLNKHEVLNRLLNPSRHTFTKNIQFEKKRLKDYVNKSCMLCGRSYKDDGNLDETFEITARRVAEEFSSEGFNLNAEQVKLVVALCRKRALYLIAYRAKMTREEMESYSFAGALAMLITIAQASNTQKMIETVIRGLNARYSV
jgi:hypothetical protein